MIYHLFEYLREIGIDLPGQGLFGYLSFRAIISFTTALLLSVFAGKRIIRWIQKKQIGEEIRDLGLEGQMQKKGTPTMGGIIIFISVIIPVILFADLGNIYTILLLISTVWFFLIGFTDDYIKVFKKNKEGRTDLEDDISKLTTTTGLLLEHLTVLNSLSKSLLVVNLGSTLVDLYAELTLQTVNDNIEVKLTHT